MSESKHPSKCTACSVTGPARGPVAIEAGWSRPRVGWLCPEHTSEARRVETEARRERAATEVALKRADQAKPRGIPASLWSLAVLGLGLGGPHHGE